jgi:hypothetical protein
MRENPLRSGPKKDFQGGGGRIQIQALFEWLSQHGADEGLSKNTTFSQIHLDGQYL